MDTDLQEYFSTMLSHLDDMAKRTIFIAGVTYGAQKGREQREAAKADSVPLQISDGVLQFTEEEIEKMPKTFRKEFRTDGCTSHIRKRPCGKGSYTYEIRYRRNGYNVTVTCKNLQEAKKKFIEKLKKAQPCDKQKVSKVPVTFSEFATYYFETFRKRKVAEKTYKIPFFFFLIYPDLKDHPRRLPRAFTNDRRQRPLQNSSRDIFFAVHHLQGCDLARDHHSQPYGHGAEHSARTPTRLCFDTRRRA